MAPPSCRQFPTLSGGLSTRGLVRCLDNSYVFERVRPRLQRRAVRFDRGEVFDESFRIHTATVRAKLLSVPRRVARHRGRRRVHVSGDVQAVEHGQPNSSPRPAAELDCMAAVSNRTHDTRSISQGEPLRSDRRAAAYILLQDQLLPDDVVSMHLVNESRGEVVASTELPQRDGRCPNLTRRGRPPKCRTGPATTHRSVE